ncbi:hypothetical protein [Sphingopyxis sp.]|uniref:hypothetical protein n=1 Tax=Sphingopyxis sp. TaxID=1908224 RepID=UPI003D0D9593
MRLFIAAAAAAFLVSAAPAQAQSVSIRNPAAFWSTLKAMGYAPTPITKADTVPEFDIEIEGFTTTLRLQGCTAGKDCKYMTLVASYSDVLNAPPTWMQKMNDEFDLLRIGTNDQGQLYMFGAYVIEGLPQSELKRIFDYWASDTAAIGQEAIDGGYTTGD